MEIGVTTFVETTPDVQMGEVKSHADRIREVIEEIVLADQVGLDVFGVGEHHRADYACSAPAVLLAAAASQTKHIRLSSAVSVISSDDPVRVYQEFATLDAISNGRAEIMAGRGSFIESFPLFGYDLQDYDELFDEKLDLYVGDVSTVAEKIIFLRKNVGITRFMLHVPVGSMPHKDVLKAIELLGTEVAPIVKAEIDRWEEETENTF